MLFHASTIPGAYLIEPEPKIDDRGLFARVFCAEEFARRGLTGSFVQGNISVSHRKGTVRGLHYQTGASAETKLVRCTRGAIYDVIVDLREDSPTYRSYLGVTLTADNRRSLYVPKHCAHAYQALSDDVEVTYAVDAPYAPAHERGLRYNDPALQIAWAEEVTVVSDKDRQWPLLQAKQRAR